MQGSATIEERLREYIFTIFQIWVFMSKFWNIYK